MRILGALSFLLLVSPFVLQVVPSASALQPPVRLYDEFKQSDPVDVSVTGDDADDYEKYLPETSQEELKEDVKEEEDGVLDDDDLEVYDMLEEENVIESVSTTEEPVETTEKPAEPTEKPTEPTEKPTEPTEKPVEPTEKPTEPTEKPVEPTEKPTEPAEKPTEKTTEPPPTTTTPVPPKVPRVSVPQFGTAIGRTLFSLEGREFYAFMSIPFADAPEGKLRFKYPVLRSQPWDQETEAGEYEATFLRARCIQQSMILNVTAGREDCLHLSIYTPVFPEESTKRVLPVMVWFHGGAYMTGDASLYIPSKLMDQDVMVVVVQYRLGSLGFLAGGISDAPGNMGLMDQIASLRWIQKYISNFGGDPNIVTVFGQSAGGASTSWMQITPLTNASAPANEGRDLLHRAIPMSGSALELWTIDQNPDDGFWQTADILGCHKNSTPKTVKCMRDDRSAVEINHASLKIYGDDRMEGGLGFKGLCPVVQGNLSEADPNIEIVIPEPPEDMLREGNFMKIPMMTGSVRDEGSLVTGLAYKDYMFPNGYYANDTDFVRYEAINALLDAFGLSDKNAAVANSMKVAYFPNAEMGNWTSMVGGMIDMTGVLFLKSGLWEVANQINRVEPDVPIYFYSWEFEGDDSLFPWIFSSMSDIPVPGGIGHADELPYLFHLPGKLDDRQKLASRRARTLWTNFAKYGNPTPAEVEKASEVWEGEIPQWERYNNEDYKFMLIADELGIEQDFTTRWHHNRDKQMPKQSNKEETPEVIQLAKETTERNGATGTDIMAGVLEGILALALVAGIIFVVFQRQTGKPFNAIV